jgi:cytochrome c oxidase subunit 2
MGGAGPAQGAIVQALPGRCSSAIVTNLKGEPMHWIDARMLAEAVLLAVLGVSGPLSGAQAAPHRIEVTAKRFTFEPEEITLKKGEPVVIVLKSKDVAHGLRFRDLNVEAKVGAGGTAELKFTPEKTGEFFGHCYVFCGTGHGSMAMRVRVVE